MLSCATLRFFILIDQYSDFWNGSCSTQPLMEDLWWKMTFDGRGPLTEDFLWRKTTIDGRQPAILMLVTIRWTVTIPYWKYTSVPPLRPSVVLVNAESFCAIINRMFAKTRAQYLHTNFKFVRFFKRRQVASIRPNVCRSVCLSVCLCVEIFFKIKKIKRIKFDYLIFFIFLLRSSSSWSYNF